MERKPSLPSLYYRNKNSISLHRPQNNILKRINHQQRKWFEKRGKSSSVIFTTEMLNRLRQHFNDLDVDRSGAIGLEELEQPLITLEFCQSREEVMEMIQAIDLDGSGEVQFGEFLEIFRKIKLRKYSSKQQAAKMNTFAAIFDNKNKENTIEKDINYRLALSELRRKKMIQDLTTNIPLKPKQFKRKQINVPFLKKVKSQFIKTEQTKQIFQSFKNRQYFRMKLE